MFRSGDPAFVSFITPHLENENNRVRANAILGTIKLSSNEEDIRKALYSLSGMLRSVSYKHRASAAAAIGEIGLECFCPALETLFSDGDVSVRKAALAACEKIGSRKFLPELKSMLADPENSTLTALIQRTVSRIENNVFDRLLNILKACPASEKAYVNDIVRKIKKAETVELIILVLSLGPADFSIKLAGLISEYPDAPELLKITEDFVHQKTFPAKHFLEETIIDGKSFPWEAGLLSALAAGLRDALRTGLIELIDKEGKNAFSDAASRKFFEALGCYINDGERAKAIYESVASADAVKSDLALELLESIKEEELKSGYIRLCQKMKKA
ncbi:MAG TPA: HEAT repeat domain-containing protein, partial [Candidatus Wallbacteria bacterium]|nr:HEAT repeat domain-containing protein [Candidatus Wallbacteria bacterium]